MKKTGLFLFAVVMMVGAVGMVGCGTDKLEIADMAGTYTFSKLTGTPPGGTLTTFTPPDISGSMTLTSSGSVSLAFTILGDSQSGSGTFTVDDPKIAFTIFGDTVNGVITNDGKTITITNNDVPPMVLEFTKQ